MTRPEAGGVITSRMNGGTAPLVHRLACPECRSPARPEAGMVVCAGCGRRYPIAEGVIRFVDGAPSDIYEHGCVSHFVPRRHHPLLSRFHARFLTEHYVTLLERYVPANASVLDLGSSGGTGWLEGRWVAGLDRSLSGSRLAAHHYDVAVQADAARIPFADGTFDAVVSRFFWEHIAPPDKPAILRECHRVLKDGGALVFLFDLDSQNVLFRWAKGHPDLYRKYFVELRGHVGYQRASENLVTLARNGFTVLEYRASSKTFLQSPAVYGWLDNEYRDRSALIRAVTDLRRHALRSATLGRLYQVVQTAVDDLVEPFLPLDDAFRLLVAGRKMPSSPEHR